MNNKLNRVYVAIQPEAGEEKFKQALRLAAAGAELPVGKYLHAVLKADHRFSLALSQLK